MPWMTYKDGPGGKPLGPAPKSVPFAPPGFTPSEGSPVVDTRGPAVHAAASGPGRRRAGPASGCGSSGTPTAATRGAA